MNVRPVGAGLFHADRQTDMPKLILVFHNFANAPPKMIPSTSYCITVVFFIVYVLHVLHMLH
jgi:hypothetical protein